MRNQEENAEGGGEHGKEMTQRNHELQTSINENSRGLKIEINQRKDTEKSMKGQNQNEITTKLWRFSHKRKEVIENKHSQGGPREKSTKKPNRSSNRQKEIEGN